MKSTWSLALLGLCPALAFGQQGSWELPFFWGTEPLGGDATVAVNLVHVWDGETMRALSLTFGTAGLDRLWTPPPISSPGAPGVFDPAPYWDQLLFCGGHTGLADGDVLHVGGVYDWRAALFTPWEQANGYWNVPTQPANMAWPRWYPTATSLSDGRVLVSSGHHCDPGYPLNCPDPWVRIPELYDPATQTFAELTSAERQQPLYPYMFVLPDGNLADAGPGESRILNSATWTWGDIIAPPSWPVPPPPAPGDGGSAVMYEPGKIMRCGGQNNPAIGTTWVLGADGTMDGEWKVAGPMNESRRNFNLVILPDGKVLAVGGNKKDAFTNPVRDAEIWDPRSGAWTLEAASHPDHDRGYHSTAMLLPDGRVVSAGQNDNPTGQIFRPPYFQAGVPRPTIISAPEYMAYGVEYRIDYLLDVENGGGAAAKAALIRLGAVTHGFDQSQRYVPLTITEWDPIDRPQQYINVAAPPDGNHAPPGVYMLFILNEHAVNQFGPSKVAAYVMVGE